ncbi:MAG: EamA family transporter [Pararhodobacter sp.]
MPTPLLLILTAAGFGASPFLIAQAVAFLPPWTLAALRAAMGLPLLLLAAGALGPQLRPDRHDLITALVGGTLVVSIPFVSMAAGMQYIPSGMGGMLYATMPLFTMGLAAVFLKDEPPTLEQGTRIGIGVLGVLMISIPAILVGGFGQAGWGTLLTLISPLSYAAGNVWFRRRRKMAPLVLSSGMFAVGAVTVWPLALLIDGVPQVAPSLTVIGTLAALVVLATVAPALLNYMLVQRAGANKAALAMFLMPAFAVLFGWLFLNERLPLVAFLGLGLVIAASTLQLPARWRAIAPEAQAVVPAVVLSPEAAGAVASPESLRQPEPVSGGPEAVTAPSNPSPPRAAAETEPDSPGATGAAADEPTPEQLARRRARRQARRAAREAQVN